MRARIIVEIDGTQVVLDDSEPARMMAEEIMRRLPECDEPDCRIHAPLRGGQCEAKHSNGTRCVLRLGHLGRHIIVT